MKENSLIQIVKSLRMPEAFLISGFIVVGSLFGIYDASSYQFKNLIIVIVISYTLMLAVYSSNAYLGFNEDKINPRLKSLTLFSKTFYLFFTILFYSISFVSCFLLNPSNIYLHLLIFVLWFLYSVPRFGKHLPVIGTVIHFIVAVIQFNFAYSFFNQVSENSVLISCYFALLFSSGHLHHEIIDYEVDAENSINSSAVKWGIKNMKYVSFGLFILANIFWTYLFICNYIRIEYFIIFFIGFLVHCCLFIFYNNQFENTHAQRIKYRFLYRAIYLICGVILTYTILS